MKEKKKVHPKVKSELHPRNQHRERYDFKLLIESCVDQIVYDKVKIKSGNKHDILTI